MSNTITLALDFERADPAQVKAFEGVPSGNVSDAAGRHVGVPHTIQPITGIARFAGSALTIDTGRGTNLGVWAAMEHVRPGDVLVIATHDSRDRAVIGDLLAGFVYNSGAVAIVTDGMVRDAEALDAMGRPVFAAGITPVGPSKDGSVSVGLPITLGQQRIASGDVIVGDRDGVVIVPKDRIGSAINGLSEIAEHEGSMEAQIKAGSKVPKAAAEVLAKAAIVRTE